MENTVLIQRILTIRLLDLVCYQQKFNMLLFQEYMHPGQHIEDKPVKEEFQVAKWIRKNVPIKRTKFLNHNVEYFTGKLTIKCENFL